MTRSYSAHDLVTVPTLNAASAVALGRALVAAAQSAGKLPEPVARAEKKLKTAHYALANAFETPAADDASSDEMTADTELDAAWSALHLLVRAWARLPLADNDPTKQAAHDLEEKLFPTGLRFLQLRHREEWAESSKRLALIDTPHLTASLKKVGATRFLEVLHEKQSRYGAALGVTTAKSGAPARPAVQELMLAFNAALRTYVLRVSSHVDDDDQNTQHLADALLAPLTSWRDSRAAKRATPNPGGQSGGDAGGPPPGTGGATAGG